MTAAPRQTLRAGLDADLLLRALDSFMGDVEAGVIEDDGTLEQRIDAARAALAQPARIDIIHVRDPDFECDHTVYLNGTRIGSDQVSIEDVDPGRGYQREDYEERLEEAQEAATRPEATDFDRDYLQVIEAAEPTYKKWSTDRDWR